GNSFSLNFSDGQFRPERTTSQQYELLRCISAIEIERGISFGEATRLRLSHCLREGSPSSQFVQHEVAGAVQYSTHTLQRIGLGKLFNELQHGDCSTHAGSVAKRRARLCSDTKQFGSIFGQNQLIGRNHVLSLAECCRDQAVSRLFTSDQQIGRASCRG